MHMSTKNKKPSTASLRKLEMEKHQRQLDQFERTVKFQIRQAKKRPPLATSFALTVGIADKKGEVTQVFHGGGPPGLRVAFVRNL
jgi:hypothetical protein